MLPDDPEETSAGLKKKMGKERRGLVEPLKLADIFRTNNIGGVSAPASPIGQKVMLKKPKIQLKTLSNHALYQKRGSV